ncbi:C1 family peptidase [Thiocystis minor]|uniref:C1 family peptidase n=1 Tax=Thiocystis minor TaxID=61597 RepID=UPI00191342C2|nr:C1 family peptidase [Thiocystis minor]
MTLELPAGNQPVTLELQTRLSAGYRWEVIPTRQGRYAESDESRFEMRYPGFGAPAIQTLELQSTGAGDGVVQLVYRRPFDTQEPIHARLQMRVVRNAGLIEITDPTPTELLLEDASQTTANGDPYAQLLAKALPASYDARTLGIVPPVRDQKTCGSCWSFGTVAVMETAIKKGGGPLADLSEQFLISCNKNGWGCNGGLTASQYHYNTLGYSQTVAGAVLETAKPYLATNGSCPSAYPHPYKASAWQFITGSEWTMPTNDQIKNAIITYGAVTAGVCVDNGWDSYTGGVYRSTSNVCNGSTNHQIALVGWNDATQSWILRNSWGPNWGESGYMRIAYDPAGKTSRVGEGTSWIKYVGTTPPSTIPTTYTPSGITYSNTPTYTWSRIAGVNAYRLRVRNVATGLYPINGVTVSSAFCSTVTNRCSYTPMTALPYNTSYQWQVAAGNGAYSAFKPFAPAPGFVSPFSGSAPGWIVRPGGAWANSGITQFTNGMASKWSTISYNQRFQNFTYEARMKRLDTSGWSSGVRIRGDATFDADNDQRNDYQLVYAVSGVSKYFSVWKHTGGVETALKGWTTTAAVKANDWNTLKVSTWGATLRFYINGILVWSGSDAAMATGQVGLTMYRGSTPSRLDVDWARLGMSDVYKAAAVRLEEGQVPLATGAAIDAAGSSRMPLRH